MVNLGMADPIALPTLLGISWDFTMNHKGMTVSLRTYGKVVGSNWISTPVHQTWLAEQSPNKP